MRARLALAAVLIALLALPVGADPGLPGGALPSPDEFSLSPYWYLQNGVGLYREQVTDEQRLFMYLYPSFLSGSLKLQSPRVVYQRDEGRAMNFVAGGQQARDMAIQLSSGPFEGLRSDFDLWGTRITALHGTTTTDNLPLLLAVGNGFPRFRLSHVAMARRIGRKGSYRLTGTMFNPTGSLRARHHRLVSFEVEPEKIGPFFVNAGIAHDDVPGSPLSFWDRSAFQWSVFAREDRFTFNGRQFRQGLGYGPVVEGTLLRGSDQLSLDGRVRLLDKLQYFGAYRVFSLEGLNLRGQRTSTSSANLAHTLDWRPTRKFGMLANYTGQSAALAGDTSKSTSMGLQAFYAPSDALSVNMNVQRGSQSGGTSADDSSTGLGLGVAWEVMPSHLVNVNYNQNTLLSNGIPGLTTTLNGGYQWRFPEDTGSLRLDYIQLSSRLPNQAPLSTRSMSAALEYRPTGRWNLKGAYSRTEGGITGVLEQYALGVDYVVDENMEVGLAYREDTSRDLFFGPLTAFQPSHTWSLELRQGFGGPLEERLHQSLLARLSVTADYRLPDGSPWTPPEQATARLSDLQAVEMDEGGRVRFMDLEAGTYPLTLDLRRLGQNYEVVGPAKRQVELVPAGRQTESFEVTAWSAVRLVAWNNVDALPSVPVGYIPFEGVRLRLSDGRVVETDAAGVAWFPRLEQGTYRLETDPASLPEGVVPLGPTAWDLEVGPGELREIEMPLQGRGTLQGRITLVPRGGAKPEPAPPGVLVWFKKRELGRSEEGRYSVEAPAGRLEIRLDPTTIESSVYVLGEATREVKVEPAKIHEIDWELAYYGAIEVSMEADGKPVAAVVPVDVKGVGFRYLDERGRLTLGRLPMGRYEVTIVKESLPSGYGLAGPETMEVDLASGEIRRVVFKLRREAGP